MNELTKQLYLKEMRRIAALPDPLALLEMAKFIESFQTTDGKDEVDDDVEQDDSDFENDSITREDALEEIAQAESAIQALKKEIKAGGDCDELSDAVNDLYSAEEIGGDWNNQILEDEFSEKIKDLHKEAADLRLQSDRIHFQNYLKDLLTKNIKSGSAAERLIYSIDNFQSILEGANKVLLSEFATGIRKAKERAAWFRAAKKLDEIEIAEAKGDMKKADCLRKEAAVMLKQVMSFFALYFVKPVQNSLTEKLNRNR